jgi:hypothetical protein
MVFSLIVVRDGVECVSQPALDWIDEGGAILSPALAAMSPKSADLV